jgi:hypothetical protein
MLLSEGRAGSRATNTTDNGATSAGHGATDDCAGTGADRCTANGALRRGAGSQGKSTDDHQCDGSELIHGFILRDVDDA